MPTYRLKLYKSAYLKAVGMTRFELAATRPPEEIGAVLIN